MKRNSIAPSTMAIAFLGLGLALNATTAAAQDSDSPNRFTLSYQVGLNLTAKFKNVGGFRPLGVPRYTLDGDQYNYDNGYVLVDASGNQLGYTRYWGYDSSSQVPGNGTIVMNRSSAASDAVSENNNDDPTHGFLLAYNRELLHRDAWSLELEAAFGFTTFDIKDDATLTSSAVRLTDVYGIPSGVNVFPPPGYQGRKSTPGTVINGSPSSSTVSTILNAATTSGDRRFSADLYNLRLGPSFRIPIGDRFSASISGGFALAYVESDFRYNETVGITGVSGYQTQQGRGSHSDWLPGGYVAASLSASLTKALAITAGAQFQDVGQYTHTVSGKQAVLDLRSSIFVTLGLSYSF